MLLASRKPVKVQTENLKGDKMSNTENSYSETDLGNVSPNPRGEYDPETSYEYLDLVNYKGGSYLCLAELETTVTGVAPAHGKNTDTWQLLTLPGDLTPEYIAMHDDVANKAKQVEDSRAAVEQSQEEIEASQADVQQLHSDTVEAAQEASDSRDSAAGYAQAAETSRQAAAESEQNVNAQITGFDTHVSESVTQAQEEIAATRQQAIRAVASQQVTSTQAVKDQTASYITEIGNYTSEKVADIQTTGETAMSNLQTEATKQQEYIKTSIDDTLSISGKAADAAVTGKKIDSLKEDAANKITKFYANNLGEMHITDSDNGKIQDMQIFGRSEQKKYNGYQLFALAPINLSTGEKVSLPYTENGITVDIANDGIGYTVRGTNTLNEQGSDIYLSMSNAFDIEAGTYTRSGKIINGNNNVELISGGGASNGGCLEYRANKVDFTFTETVKKGKSGNFVIRISPSATVNAIVYFQIEKGSEAHGFEPYVGGQPSPSPDYPQEIKSVVNPVVKLTNEDGTQFETVTLSYTLNAVPVESGGNVTIDGQRYIADYVDVERGKLVRCVEKKTITASGASYDSENNRFMFGPISDNIKGSIAKEVCTHFIYSDFTHKTDLTCKFHSLVSYIAMHSFGDNVDKFIEYINSNNVQVVFPLDTSVETDLTPEEVQAFKALATYYPVTNISVNSEQLDGYTIFNYPISMANGWNYVKKQLNDNRNYIYDMYSRTQDIDTQAAEAYVNSEYAVALTELEV